MAELSIEEINELANQDPAVTGVAKLAKQKEAESQQRSAPTAKPASAKPARTPGVPNAKTNPVGAVGFLAGQFGAGAQGRETPLEKIRKTNLQQEELSIRRANVGLQAVAAGTKELTGLFKSGTPTDEQLEQFFSRFAEFDKMAPGTVESLRFLAEQRKAGNEKEIQQFESVLEANGVNIATLGMPLREIKNLWDISPEFKKAMMDKADARHLSTGVQKVGDINTQMAQGAIPEQEINLATAIDVINPQLTGENADKRLTENEVQALLRNPAQMQKLGITPDEIILAEAKGGVDTTEVTQALKFVAAGIDLTDSPFSEETKQLVSGLTPAQAKTTLDANKGRGETITLPDGTVISRGGSESAAEKKQRLKTEEALTQKRIGTTNLVREINRGIDIVENDPNITTSVAGLAQLTGSLTSNMQTLVELTGVDVSKLTGGLDFRQYDDQFFGNLAEKSAGLKTLAFNLAIMAAASKGQTGKSLSDKDVEREIRSLGASIDDPVQVLASMKETRRLAIENFKTEFKTRKGEEFTEFDKFISGNRFESMGDDEFKAVDFNDLSTKDLRLFVAEEKKRNK